VPTSRLEAFSDGVFAIAATLVVLELRVPSDTSDVGSALLRLWPAYAAYLVSFLTIGIIWVSSGNPKARVQPTVVPVRLRAAACLLTERSDSRRLTRAGQV
jgi:uncharacterized membrane protein